MPTATANGIDLYYETHGDPAGEPLLLVMGFTAQLIAWPDELIDALTGLGYFVIRHDNRDCGLSTKSAGPPPDSMALMARALGGEDIAAEVPYTLSDMAADAVGLLDHLGIESAHVAGASMGGMIVQHLAVEHPTRLRSVTSIMSTTGDRQVGQAKPEAMGALLAPPPQGREAMIAQGIEGSRVISGPLWNRETAAIRTAAAFDRSFHPIGAAFQMAAIFASGDRTPLLAGVDLPFLVIHGRADDLIDVSGGLATAEAVPNADLLVLAQMGHDLPPALVPQIADAHPRHRPTGGLRFTRNSGCNPRALGSPRPTRRAGSSPRRRC